MRKQFVKTENYSRFTAGIAAVEQRGAAEAGMSDGLSSLPASVRELVELIGLQTAMRGQRHGPHRPDLVICDDLENDENVKSPEQRDKLESWLKKTVLSLGEAGDTMIEIEVHIAALDALLGRAIALGANMTPITRALAGVLADIPARAFANQADPETGQAWAPLKPSTVKRRGSKEPILHDTHHCKGLSGAQGAPGGRRPALHHRRRSGHCAGLAVLPAADRRRGPGAPARDRRQGQDQGHHHGG